MPNENREARMSIKFKTPAIETAGVFYVSIFILRQVRTELRLGRWQQ
jgi:hypothetical protein